MLPAKRFNGLGGLPDLFNDFFDNGGIERISTKAPAINVIEDDNKYKIEVATPGMTKDDFKVHVNKDGNLVIEMEKARLSSGSFMNLSRTVPLPTPDGPDITIKSPFFIRASPLYNY